MKYNNKCNNKNNNNYQNIIDETPNRRVSTDSSYKFPDSKAIEHHHI